jgi:hypothetical protein
MHIKKSLLLLLTVVLVFSCNKDELLDQNTDAADLTADISQYDTANLGLYKGTFTTNDASERGIVEIKILDNAASRATLTLTSGAIYNLQSTETVASNQDVTNLRFVSIADLALPVSFDFSVTANGSNVEITDTTFGKLDSHILIAKETSRVPVLPIAGTFALTQGVHPSFGLGPQTFNLLFIGDPTGAGSGTLDTDFTLNGTVFSSVGTTDNNQAGCSATGGYTDCSIVGFTPIGAQNMTWSGIHKYDSSSTACSQANGTWTYVSPAYGSLAGTFTSDVQCAPAAIGDLRLGGVVFWVDPADNRHGLVCALSDYVGTREWGCLGTDLPNVPNVPNIGGNPPNGPGAEIGDGLTNTIAILTDCPTAPAALAARSYGPEWFLPSAKELNDMYVHKTTLEAVPGFIQMNNPYWSSSEDGLYVAWLQVFNSGLQGNFNKDFKNYVRAVRAF